MKDSSSFRAHVLIGIAAAFCAAFIPHGTNSPCVATTLAEVNHPVTCPPQWLPVLLAFHSRHDDSPKFPFDGDVEGPAIRARPASASASSEPLPPPRTLSLYTDPLSQSIDMVIKAAAGVMCSLLWECGPPPAPMSTWQCNPQDGSVSQNGVTVDASVPCNWGLTEPSHQAEAMAGTKCAGAEILAAIEKHEVNRNELQVVVVRHAEDISWSDPFAAVRTVYEKPGQDFAALPPTPVSATAAASDVASVVLPNVGKEQHAYLTHIVRNYDSLAERTVFMHGTSPTCGFFLVDPNHLGNHLLTNVSVLDYVQSEGDLYMPLTGRANHDLTLASVRSTFADGLSPRPRVSRPVPDYPIYGADQESKAEEGGGDRWLKWETNDLSRHAKELTLSKGELSAVEMIDFGTFFQRVIGRAPPAVLYFAHGAQFAASRAALQSTPKETYEWILAQVEAGHFELTFYLEMSWLYVLHGALETDWDAATVDPDKAAPYLDHLAKARDAFKADAAKSSANERRSLAASPEPEVSSPPPSPLARSCLEGAEFYECFAGCHTNHATESDRQKCKLEACPPLCCLGGDARYECVAGCHKIADKNDRLVCKSECQKKPLCPSWYGALYTVVLELTVRGSISDFADDDKSNVQQKVADAAGVDKELVTISVAPASVHITATIAVHVSKTADEMQTSLSSTLGTAADASAALNVTVEEVPTITVTLAKPSSPSPAVTPANSPMPPPSPPPPSLLLKSDSPMPPPSPPPPSPSLKSDSPMPPPSPPPPSPSSTELEPKCQPVFGPVCIALSDPVCGKDGVTYSNKCFAEAACQLDGSKPGKCACKPDPGAICFALWEPVCGKDGVTYSNTCWAEAACQLDGSRPGACEQCGGTASPVIGSQCGRGGTPCGDGYYCDVAPTDAWAVCCPSPCGPKDKKCTKENVPVCGKDGVTYPNKCMAEAACQGWTPGKCACKPRVQMCTEDWDPVCGKDGVTYGNKCKAEAACQFDGSTPGECTFCKPDPTPKCTKDRLPVCGEDGVTYTNKCMAEAACQGWTPGKCACKPRVQMCTEDWDPVCGKDGVTYGNACKALLVCQLDGSKPGACACKPNPTPMCTKEKRPVCGEDGVTYPNKCMAEAACQGWTPGKCACKPNPGAVCIANWDPVCGKDGVTYSNTCWAEAACQLDGSRPGACEQVCLHKPGAGCILNWDPVCGKDGVTYSNKCFAEAACQLDGSKPGACHGKY